MKCVCVSPPKSGKRILFYAWDIYKLARPVARIAYNRNRIWLYYFIKNHLRLVHYYELFFHSTPNFSLLCNRDWYATLYTHQINHHTNTRILNPLIVIIMLIKGIKNQDEVTFQMNFYLFKHKRRTFYQFLA